VKSPYIAPSVASVAFVAVLGVLGLQTLGSSQTDRAVVLIAEHGLTALASADTEVHLGPVAGEVVLAAPGVSVAVERSDSAADTLTEELKRIRVYKPSAIRGSDLEDGWIMRFENLGPLGKNHWVTAMRDLGGTKYACMATAGNAREQQSAFDVCKSLRTNPKGNHR